MSRIIHDVQLVEDVNRTQGGAELYQASGGMFVVTAADDPALATLTDPDNDFASLSQPVSLDQGKIRFAVANTVNSVDIFGITGDGRPFVILGRSITNMGSFHTLPRKGTQATLVVPFSMDDATAATEYDTGIEIPAGTIVLPQSVGIKVATVDATETIDVGLLSGEAGGDADGFLDGVSVATAGHVIPTLDSGGQTLGVLLSADEDGSGALVPEAHLGDGTAKTVSYTLSAGSDTAEGYILLPVIAPNAP